MLLMQNFLLEFRKDVILLISIIARQMIHLSMLPHSFFIRVTVYDIYTNSKPKWQKPALNKVKKLWWKYRESAPISIVSCETQSQERDLDKYDQAAQVVLKFTRPATQDGYDDYTSRDPFDIGKMSALTWWCQEEQ